MTSFLAFQVEQITAEYKAKALQYHPDKNEGNKEAEAKFQLLKVSFPISNFPRQQSKVTNFTR